MVVLCLIPESNIAQWILNDRLENVRRLHPNLLRKATVIAACRLLHVELVYDDFEDVKFLHF